MGALTDLDGDFPASDDDVEAAIEEAAAELGVDEASLEESVAHMIDSGTGMVTNEGVGGPRVASNPDAEGDPRLEAIELYKLQNQL